MEIRIPIAHPKAKRRQRIQSMRALIVLHETAAVSPSRAAVLLCLWWTPLPLPLKGNRFLAAGRKVADELDIGVLVEVWVGVKFEGDEVLDFFGCGSCNVCEAVYDGVDEFLGIGRAAGR